VSLYQLFDAQYTTHVQSIQPRKTLELILVSIARRHSSNAAPSAGTDNHPVIDCRAPFLFLFWRSKKEKDVTRVK
jgi:hypothetical protein